MPLKDLIQVVATLRVCFIEKRGNKHPSNKTVCHGRKVAKWNSTKVVNLLDSSVRILGYETGKMLLECK